MSKIHIVLAADDNYAPYCATTIASVLANSNKSTALEFYILFNRISDENKKKFLHLQEIKKCELNFISVGKELKNFPVHHYFTSEIYFRLKIASLLPELEKVIYLDSDMIVLRDLNDVYNMNIEDFFAAMVKDVGVGITLEGNLIRLGLPSGSNYFNSGFILLNLERIRKETVEETILSWANKNKKRLLFPDQDILNVVLSGKIKDLPEKYNLQLYYYDSLRKISKFKEKPYIIHYNGPRKPWNVENMLLARYFMKYFKYCKW